MSRFTSRRDWAPSRYAYGKDLRLRLDLPIGVDLPAGPQTVWIGKGARAIRVDITVVDRSETPWGSREGADQ